MRRILPALVLSLAAGPALAQKVAADYDKSVDFSKFHSYAWRESTNPARSEENHRLLIQAIDEQLAAKGLKKVQGGEPDLEVVYNGGLEQSASGQGTDPGYTGYGAWGVYGWGLALNDQTIILEGTLIVDLVDSRLDKPVWRGVAKDTLSETPEKNTGKIKRAVAKMFKKYPQPGK